MSDKNEWSTIDAIKEISPDWQEKTLNCFSTMKRNSFVNGPFGSDLLSSDMQLDGGVPVVYIRDICDGRYIRKSEVFVTFEKAEKLSACKTEYGDILISKVGDPPCEAAIYTGTENAIVTQDVIRVSTGSRALSEFLTYVLNSDIGKRQVKRIKITGTRERVSLTDFKKLKFLSPPLPEQIKIAEILSTWDNAINTVQKLLANSQQQKKALMQQLLTGKKRFSGFEEEWEEKRFADLYWYQEGPGVRKHQFTEVGVKLFNGTNIQNSNIDLSKTTTHIASEEAYGTYAHFLVDEGDLVIACSGISVEKFDEKIAFVEKHHLPLCMNTSTMRFKTLNPQCSSIKFLRYFLSSKSFKSQIGKQATGSAQLNFGPSHVAKCKIELPNIDEQQKIAAILTTADQEIDNLRAQLNHIKQEKKALMQQLLTGKRRVKVEEAA